MNRRGTIRALAALLVCAASLTCEAGPEGVAILRVYVDSRQNVRVAYTDGTEREVRSEEDQVSCEAFAVAEDRQTAGWLVDYPNPEVTYAVPMTLIVYRSGKVLRRITNGFVIERWSFLNGGSLVAFHSNTMHGNRAPYYELRDIASDHVVDRWRGPLGEKAPRWARQLSGGG